MKKILLIVLFALCLSGCSKSENNIIFSKQTFTRNSNYERTFHMLYGETKDVSIGFLENLFNEEEIGLKAKIVIEDVKKLEQVYSNDHYSDKLSIYILDSTIYDEPYVVGRNVFCSKDDFESGVYKEALTQGYFNLEDKSLSIGLAGYCFDEKFDNEVLIDYYSNEDDISVLGLFGGRFYDGFNTNVEIEIARKTTLSLTDYIIMKYGFDTLLNGFDAQLKQEWLDSLGIKREYDYPYEGKFTNFHFSKSSEYPLIVKTDQVTYYFQPIESVLNESQEIEYFIHKDIDGRKYILNFLKEHMEDYRLINNSQIDCYVLSGTNEKNGGDTLGNKITLYGRISPHLHEATHVFVRESLNASWKYEGMAEYINLIVYPYSYYKETLTKEYLENGTKNQSQVVKEAFEYYFNQGGRVTSTDGIDMRLYVDSIAYASLHTNSKIDQFNTLTTPINEVYGLKTNMEGNELTYFQANSFLAYLADFYSIEDVIKFYTTDLNIEDVFQKTYAELKAEWIAYLER